jgi:sterol 3beta-glucosyltransferase
MHYAIITYGSRGDVQPFIALALGLMDRGHQVTLLAPANFKNFVEGHGVVFFSLHGDVEAIVYSPEGLRLLKTGNTLSLLRYMQKCGRELQPLINQNILTGCADADVLVASTLCAIWVNPIGEKSNKKVGIVQFNPPTTPTKAFPFAGLAFFNSPRYNLFTYRFLESLYWHLNKKGINQFRESLHLPVLTNPAKDKSQPAILNLYAISPQLIAPPADWDSNVKITGFLTLPLNNGDDKIPGDLKKWLKNGEKPVYVGFGSIPVPNPELLSKILNHALAAGNLRVIFCSGWSVVPGLTPHPSLFTVKHINHQWLFPQCKAAVIHGGSGTLAAVLKAKIPAIIVSVFADQPWWGKIIQDKKLGVHIPFKKLTAEKLLGAIALSQTPQIIKNAGLTGENMNKEDGLGQAITALENYFS